MSHDKKLGTSVDNKLDSYKKLCFYVTGTEGHYHFRDDLSNEMFISWKDGHTKVNVISGNTQYCIVKNL